MNSNLLYLAIFAALLIGILGLLTIRGEGAKCMVEPLSYAIKTYSEVSNMSCTCSFQDNQYGSFIINPDGFSSLNRASGLKIINFTELNLTFSN